MPRECANIDLVTPSSSRRSQIREFHVPPAVLFAMSSYVRADQVRTNLVVRRVPSLARANRSNFGLGHSIASSFARHFGRLRNVRAFWPLIGLSIYCGCWSTTHRPRLLPAERTSPKTPRRTERISIAPRTGAHWRVSKSAAGPAPRLTACGVDGQAHRSGHAAWHQRRVWAVVAWLPANAPCQGRPPRPFGRFRTRPEIQIARTAPVCRVPSIRPRGCPDPA